MIVSESLEQLYEDLGTLKPFKDIPEEWKKKLLHSASYKGMGGEHSLVKELPIDADYKTLLKGLKDDNLIIAIIKKDGKSAFMIERDSNTPNKFNLRKADAEYSIQQKRREAEKKAREAERLARQKNESLNPPKANEINERRARVHHYDEADLGKLSIPQIQEWIETQKKENPNSTYQIFLIFVDIERGKKRQERSDIRNIEDPYKGTAETHNTNKEFSRKQKERYDIFAEKKRAELDKELDRVLDDFKQQLVDNFDKSMEKIVHDMRRGYSWNVDIKQIGEAILKGVDITELKKFTDAYDAIEPDNYKKDAAEAARKFNAIIKPKTKQ